eukprot:5919534-Amphidinium_carterae.1
MQELNLDLGHSKVCFGDMFPKFAEALPPLLETLCLDIYGCTVAARPSVVIRGSPAPLQTLRCQPLKF